jgi:hypothetical protein
MTHIGPAFVERVVVIRELVVNGIVGRPETRRMCKLYMSLLDAWVYMCVCECEYDHK